MVRMNKIILWGVNLGSSYLNSFHCSTKIESIFEGSNINQFLDSTFDNSIIRKVMINKDKIDVGLTFSITFLLIFYPHYLNGQRHHLSYQKMIL
jgi:hypothetical protein